MPVIKYSIDQDKNTNYAAMGCVADNG